MPCSQLWLCAFLIVSCAESSVGAAYQPGELCWHAGNLRMNIAHVMTSVLMRLGKLPRAAMMPGSSD